MNTSNLMELYPHDMVKGPSPFSPTAYGGGSWPLSPQKPSLLTLSIPVVTEGENTIFMCLVFKPSLVLLAIYSVSHTIVLPLVFILVTYTVTTMLLGSLVLILIVYLSCAYLASVKCNGEELGWGCLIVFGFFLLHWFCLRKASTRVLVLVLAIIIFMFTIVYLSCRVGIL